ANQLSQLEVYLNEVLDRRVLHAEGLDHAAYDIVPILVAKRLGIDEGLALVLLGYVEQAGIIVHRYDVYCPNTENFLAKFESKEELPDYIYCQYEERTEHSIHEYFVEVVFNFSPKFVQDHNMVVSM
ncbi:MAG TPA: hypothetical protein VE732_02315, partial [Nitrososphaera sp.]|nr:hypothetical protein [Nitrososphaera sp.]